MHPCMIQVVERTEGIIINRYNLGVLFGVVGAILSLSEFTLVFLASISYVDIIAYTIGWYLVTVGLAMLLLFGAFTAYKGRKTLGGRILLITSILAIIVNLALLMIPGPVGSMIPIFYYQPMIAGNWCILSIIGGIIIVTDKTKPKD